MKNIDEYADEVIAGINQFIDQERAARHEPVVIPQTQWAHRVGLVCAKHGLDEATAKRVVDRLPAAVERYMAQANKVARVLGVSNAS